MNSLEKVTAFIVHSSPSGIDLLLFKHPTAGIQIPAGTVEENETPQTAVLREAAEESGLEGLEYRSYLGSRLERHPQECHYIAHLTPVYARPDLGSIAWAQIRRGIPVAVLRKVGGFCQVQYQEKDRLPDPQYISYSILGWVPEEVLVDHQERHFYLLEATDRGQDRWEVSIDNHVFTLFWTSLNPLPEIIFPQSTWLPVLLGDDLMNAEARIRQWLKGNRTN